MDYFKYKEDTSVEGRIKEIEIKLGRIYDMLSREGMEALLLLKHPNFSWITAGGKSFVANCFDTGAVAILITQKERFAICNVIEESRIREEEKIEELGFELYVYPWEESKLLSFVKSKVSSMDKVISDTQLEEAKVRHDLLINLRISLVENEIGRYRYLGDTMSLAIEEYLSTEVHSGMTEYEIAGGISKALWKYNIEQVMHLVTVDERSYNFRHGLPTDKKLKNNLIVSINGRYKGLITTLSRMIYIGDIPEGLHQQYIDCCYIQCCALAKAKIGTDEIEMYNAVKNGYLEKGYPTMFEKHGQGGCQGYWPREYMITPNSHRIIQENQAYCYNPVVDGTKVEDSYIVTKEGPIFITRPISFPTIDINIDGQKYTCPDILVVK